MEEIKIKIGLASSHQKRILEIMETICHPHAHIK